MNYKIESTIEKVVWVSGQALEDLSSLLHRLQILLRVLLFIIKISWALQWWAFKILSTITLCKEAKGTQSLERIPLLIRLVFHLSSFLLATSKLEPGMRNSKVLIISSPLPAVNSTFQDQWGGYRLPALVPLPHHSIFCIIFHQDRWLNLLTLPYFTQSPLDLPAIQIKQIPCLILVRHNQG
jgi:hypothetical protein